MCLVFCASPQSHTLHVRTLQDWRDVHMPILLHQRPQRSWSAKRCPRTISSVHVCLSSQTCRPTLTKSTAMTSSLSSVRSARPTVSAFNHSRSSAPLDLICVLEYLNRPASGHSTYLVQPELSTHMASIHCDKHDVVSVPRSRIPLAAESVWANV